LDRLNDIDALAEWVGQYEIRYNLYGENFPVRRYRGIITPENKGFIDDKFRPPAKNADYSIVPTNSSVMIICISGMMDLLHFLTI
jgi:hypothetical protein